MRLCLAKARVKISGLAPPLRGVFRPISMAGQIPHIFFANSLIHLRAEVRETPKILEAARMDKPLL